MSFHQGKRMSNWGLEAFGYLGYEASTMVLTFVAMIYTWCHDMPLLESHHVFRSPSMHLSNIFCHLVKSLVCSHAVCFWAHFKQNRLPTELPKEIWLNMVPFHCYMSAGKAWNGDSWFRLVRSGFWQKFLWFCHRLTPTQIYRHHHIFHMHTDDLRNYRSWWNITIQHRYLGLQPVRGERRVGYFVWEWIEPWHILAQLEA